MARQSRKGLPVKPVTSTSPKHNAALAGVNKAVDAAEQGRLACTRAANYTHKTAWFNVQCHIAQGGFAIVDFSEVLDLQHGVILVSGTIEATQHHSYVKVM